MYDDYFKHQTMDNSTIKCCEPGCDHTQKSDPLDFLWCLTCTRMLDNNKTKLIAKVAEQNTKRTIICKSGMIKIIIA